MKTVTIVGNKMHKAFPLPDEPASPVRDVSEGEVCLTDSGFIADQDRATIAKSSTLPHDTAPRVTSPTAVEGSMQQTIHELTDLDEEEGITGRVSSDTEEIRMDEGEVAVERTSEDTEEMATVLTSMDAATILLLAVIPFPLLVPLLLTFTLAVMLFPLLVRLLPLPLLLPLIQEEREKKLWWSLTLQRNREVARIHVEEELQGMIDSLDRTNETIANYLQEYQDFALELPLERRIELISDLVKYQDNYSKIYKFQSQQRRPWTKKQKKDYYMTLVEDFIPIGSKEEDERLKRKGFNLEQEMAKKQKTSEEVHDKEKSPEEILGEKVKEMMQLVPIEEV
nr:hypothetical protein [Tanacetum cinerariifolium]